LFSEKLSFLFSFYLFILQSLFVILIIHLQPTLLVFSFRYNAHYILQANQQNLNQNFHYQMQVFSFLSFLPIQRK